jgi:VanZ family protein
MNVMLLPLRHSRGWLVVGWLLVVIATILSLMPGSSLPRVPLGADKVEHAVCYAGLTLWFTGIYPRSRYVTIAIALLAMGIAIEWAQGAMHLGRSRDVRDVIANSAGIGAGIVLALVWLGGWAQRLEEWMRERARS